MHIQNIPKNYIFLKVMANDGMRILLLESGLMLHPAKPFKVRYTRILTSEREIFERLDVLEQCKISDLTIFAESLLLFV